MPLIFPINEANLDLVELRDDGGIGKLTPHCKVHGAMNQVSEGGLWRCMSDYSIKTEWIGKNPVKTVIDTACRAGCKFIENLFV